MDYSLEKDKQMPRGVYNRSKAKPRTKPESLEIVAPLPKRKKRAGWKKKATLIKQDVMVIPVALARMIVSSKGKNGLLGKSLLSLLLDARTANHQTEQE